MKTIIVCRVRTKEANEKTSITVQKKYYLSRLLHFEKQVRAQLEFMKDLGYSSYELEGLRNLLYDALFLEHDIKYKKDVKETLLKAQVFLNTNSYFFNSNF